VYGQSGDVGAESAAATPDWAAELARLLVQELAPEELAFFDAASEEFTRAGTGRLPERRGGGADEVAWGNVEELVVLVTPAALAICAAVVAEFLQVTGKAVVARSGKAGRRLGRRLVRAKATTAEPAVIAPLSAAQLGRIRLAATEKADELGLSEDERRLLVDGLIGRLVLDPAPVDPP
jgi:hypothetical protein